MKDDLKLKMISVIGSHSNALIESIAERCAQVAIDFINQNDNPLSTSDAIAQVLQKVKAKYWQSDLDTFKIEMINGLPWVVKHTFIDFDKDQVIEIAPVKDLL